MPPLSAMEQVWTARRGGAVGVGGCGGGAESEVWTHGDGARPLSRDSGDADEVLDRLFHELMTER